MSRLVIERDALRAEVERLRANTDALKDGCDYAMRLETVYREVEAILTSSGGYVILHAKALTTLRAALTYENSPGLFRMAESRIARLVVLTEALEDYLRLERGDKGAFNSANATTFAEAWRRVKIALAAARTEGGTGG